jgi:hypothetical protein
MLCCSRCTRQPGDNLGWSRLAGTDDGIVCDFCLSAGGRICPDCDGAHFDNHRINSSRCEQCLHVLSVNGQTLAWQIAFESGRVDRTGAVDITGLEDADWSKAEIRCALEFVEDWFQRGELQFHSEWIRDSRLASSTISLHDSGLWAIGNGC